MVHQSKGVILLLLGPKETWMDRTCSLVPNRLLTVVSAWPTCRWFSRIITEWEVPRSLWAVSQVTDNYEQTKKNYKPSIYTHHKAIQWKTIFTSHVSNISLVSKIYKEHLQIKKIMLNYPIENTVKEYKNAMQKHPRKTLVRVYKETYTELRISELKKKWESFSEIFSCKYWIMI